MEKLYKNFILCGEVDYYCILCQETFADDKTVAKHLRWEKHRNNIRNQEYVHKFKKDYIYKISDKNFYCEVCNLVIQNAVDHIKDITHKDMKNSDKNNERVSYVQREENGLLKIHNQSINNFQWHSIVDSTCLLCDEPVLRITDHITSFNHMVKLIKSKTICENDQYYRKMENKNYYCFTCFKVFESKHLETHFAEHKKNSNKTAQEPSKEKTEKNSKSTNDPNNNKQEESIIKKIIKKTKKKYFSFDIEDKATCLECNEIVDLNYNAIYEHRKIHTSEEDDDLFTVFFEDKGKRRAELAKYGRDNFIKLNEGGSKGYCSLCDIYLSAHMNTAKQHVEGSYHRGHLELKGLVKDQKHEKPTTKCIPYKTFLDVMFGPFEIDRVSVVCLNDGICINVLSFMFVNIIYDFNKRSGKCYACDVTMNLFKLNEHIKSKEHSKIVSGCKVLPMKTKDDDEFIRQIHPGLYHCGYCNKVLPFWENVTRHLRSFPHEVKRQKAKLLSCICAKKYLDPLCCLNDMKEYFHLQELSCYE